jgi:hypothetical protein
MVEVLQILRAAHVLFALLWAGAAAYRYAVVAHLLEDDRAATRFFASAQHSRFMAIAATGTVLFGGATMGLNSEAYSIEAIGAGSWILGAGMGFAMLAYGVGVFGHVPLDRKLRPMAAARAAGKAGDDSSFRQLVAKEHKMGHVSSGLVGLAVLAMLVFRWF